MLDYFKFVFGDACLYPGTRYEAILETAPNGSHINWIIDQKIFTMDISKREEEFINLIKSCHIDQWDRKHYTYDGCWDGVKWEIVLGYSNKYHTKGTRR